MQSEQKCDQVAKIFAKGNELIKLYDEYIDMLLNDIILYESEHGSDNGHDKIYHGEREILDGIYKLCDFFEKGNL